MRLGHKTGTAGGPVELLLSCTETAALKVPLFSTDLPAGHIHTTRVTAHAALLLSTTIPRSSFSIVSAVRVPVAQLK